MGCPVYVFGFLLIVHQVSDFAMNDFFHFGAEFEQEHAIDLSDEDQVDYLAVDTPGEITYQVHALQFAEAMNDVFNDLIEADVFAYDAVNLRKKRVLSVCLKDFFIAFAAGGKQTGVFQPIEFQSDSIARFPELTFQAAQVGSRVAVQEELQQEFDPRFGGNECINHAVKLSSKTTQCLQAGKSGGNTFMLI